jgi:hypothetical protein
MIAYRDFRPEVEGFFPKAHRIEEKFDGALAGANRWIESESIEVLNVETIGLRDAAFESRSIRIWYRTDVKKPDPLPEI